MNTSACIIAACAANSRSRKSSEPRPVYTSEYYYKVTLRKYYRFDPLSLADFAIKICEPVEPNVSITPIPLRVINIDARSSAVQQSFSVRASECPNGIDNYIKENLAQITSSEYWQELDRQAVTDYIIYVNLIYGAKLTPDAVRYTTEYYWEVN